MSGERRYLSAGKDLAAAMNGSAAMNLSATKTVIGFAAEAARFCLHRKILLLGAVVALLAVAAIPVLSRKSTPILAANGTLKCYGSAGNYEPCVTPVNVTPVNVTPLNVTPVNASSSRSNGRPTPADQPASWTTTTLYQQARWATAAADEPANWETSPPASQRSNPPAKHASSPTCRRKLIPCFFSALRRGLTHIASAAASLGQARPAREHL